MNESYTIKKNKQNPINQIGFSGILEIKKLKNNKILKTVQYEDFIIKPINIY